MWTTFAFPVYPHFVGLALGRLTFLERLEIRIVTDHCASLLEHYLLSTKRLSRLIVHIIYPCNGIYITPLLRALRINSTVTSLALHFECDLRHPEYQGVILNVEEAMTYNTSITDFDITSEGIPRFEDMTHPRWSPPDTLTTIIEQNVEIQNWCEHFNNSNRNPTAFKIRDTNLKERILNLVVGESPQFRYMLLRENPITLMDHLRGTTSRSFRWSVGVNLRNAIGKLCFLVAHETTGEKQKTITDLGTNPGME